MGLFGWLFYIVLGIIYFFIIKLLSNKYKISKTQKFIFTILLLMITSGICFRLAIKYTGDIFLSLVFLMIIDIIYNSYFIEKDFFDKSEGNIKYYILLVVIGFFINQEFFNRVSDVFLSGEDLRIILWTLGIIFIYNFIKEKEVLKSTSDNNIKYMSVDSVLVNYVKLKNKYNEEVNYSDKDICNIIYAIMIFNNNKRSKVMRDYDYFMFRLNGNSRNLSIMQINSKKFITDSEGIEIVYKKLIKYSESITKSKTKTKTKNSKIYEEILKKYSSSDYLYLKYIFDIIKKF
jgi:hypothetical protein